MGNKLGWILAGVMVGAVLIVLLIVLVSGSATTPPTEATTRPGALDLKTIDLPIESVVGYTPSQGGNAADDYAAAINVARNEEIEQKGLRPADALTVYERVLSLAQAGAQKKEMKYTTVHSPDRFPVESSVPHARNLAVVGSMLNLLGRHYLDAGNIEKARAAYNTQMVLGWHMMNERCRARVTIAGCGEMRQAMRGQRSGASGGLLAIAAATNDSKLKEALRAWDSQINALSSFSHSKMRNVWKPKPETGDLFNIINNDEDRAWRADALLMLGLAKFTHANVTNDKKYIDELLEEYSESDDPCLRAAARSAKEFTRKQYDEFRVQ